MDKYGKYGRCAHPRFLLELLVVLSDLQETTEQDLCVHM